MQGDEDVERVRRAHRNDMENIFLFFANGAFYLATGPDPWVAINLMRLFTISRYIHTYIYLYGIDQPWRGIAWMVGASVQYIMAFATLWSCL